MIIIIISIRADFLGKCYVTNVSWFLIMPVLASAVVERERSNFLTLMFR